MTNSPDVHGTGAIAAPHTLATQAGKDAFAKGGNALDAALAAAAALTVVYPHNTALGGDLVALIRTPDGTITCVNATGPAPAEQDVNRLVRVHGEKLPVRGVDTITVPGGVRGWQEIRHFGARLDWAAQFEAAIRYAEDGVPVARSLAAAIIEESAALRADQGASAVFEPGGVPLGRGDTLRQPELARSLRQLAAEGPETLYGGALGAKLVAGLRAAGCPIALEDLATYEAEITAPMATDYAGHTVYTSPPNTQGILLLRTLRALAGKDPASVGANLLARLFLDGINVRTSLLSDPRHASVDIENAGFHDLLASLEYPRNSESALASPFVPTGDTVGVAAADSDGFAVSLIQSIYHGFGAAVLEPTTGIIMQNRGMSFSLDPASPNFIQPGKRPAHTLMPVMVCRGESLRWVNATMGGQGQPQIHAQILLGLLQGDSPQEAVSRPRWILGAQEAGDTPDTVYAEEDVLPAAVTALGDDSFPLRTVPSQTDWIGHANVVARTEDGGLDAGSDPRADGEGAVVAIAEPGSE
ncbi:gamma-glutamyltransferase family protein [Specibacter cremeus]|uniref:gamma-glutamyltransferase family protein n=1 Tax=Specibacter cremeus TaxID=1629051 RepID=UPI000F77197B|nr:gamma-glutamyltransferase [Specibacter cremeus]